MLLRISPKNHPKPRQTLRTFQLLALVVATVCLSACERLASASGGCSDADSLNALQLLLIKHGSDDPTLTAADRAAMALAWGSAVRVSVEEIRTTKRDESVQRATCAAKLKMTVPHAVLEVAATNLLGALTLKQAGLYREGDALVVGVEFTAQPTDDRKQVFVELQRGQELSKAAGVLAAAAVVHSRMPKPTGAATVGQDAAGRSGPAVPASPSVDDVPATSDLCAGLDMAVTVNQMTCNERMFEVADGALNAVYKKTMERLSSEKQAALRSEQRAWLKAKAKTCEAAGREFQGCVFQRSWTPISG